MEHNEQLQRIKTMEELFEQTCGIMEAVDKTLDVYESYMDNISMLIEYYNSDLWITDYTDDQAGKIPSDMQRGVLSEDGIYNLLTDIVRIRQRMMNLSSEKLDKSE